MTPVSGSSATPREWWIIYGAVDLAMRRELGTSPTLIASAVYSALQEASVFDPTGKPFCTECHVWRNEDA